MTTSINHQLMSIALTQADIDLITFSLRKLSEETLFTEIKADSANLLEYIEKENKELK